MDEIRIKPIGVFEGDAHSPVEAPRQGSRNPDSLGLIHLTDEFSSQSLKDIEGFSHIWLIYRFHQNEQWKEKVRPPRGGEKRGVFATRSPYRPNFLGMSCVELKGVEGKTLKVKNHDLLNQTPIFDIKPYLPYADSFPEATSGWIDRSQSFIVETTKIAQDKIDWLTSRLSISLQNILENQLSDEPTNSQIKRVKNQGEHSVFAFKTWRFQFKIDGKVVRIFDVFSGYSKSELDAPDDPYQDKEVHRNFLVNDFNTVS